MENADVYYFNIFRHELLNHQYTQDRREIFLKKSSRGVKVKSKNYGKICSNCFISMKITERGWCYFCMDYVCFDCISPLKFVIPAEFQLKFDCSPHTVCRVSQSFLQKYYYILLSPKNPLIVSNPQLFTLLEIRRKVHKLYNMIKCEALDELFEIELLRERKNLIVKDFYIKLQQIEEIKNGFLQYLLEQMARVFLNHIESCETCMYQGESCVEC